VCRAPLEETRQFLEREHRAALAQSQPSSSSSDRHCCIPLFGSVPRDIQLRHINTRQYQTGLVTSEYEVMPVTNPILPGENSASTHSD
jgi:hypothetical protein